MMKNDRHKTFLFLGFCVAGLLPLLLTGTAAGGEWGQPIYQEDSLYHRILVYKRGSVVTLRFGRQPAVQVQSQVDLNNLREHMLEYTALSFCGLLYKPEPKRILVLGLGGGVIPREMHHYFPSAEVDVVEIDPEVRNAAAKFFDFREDDKLKVHIADGRMFIREQIRKEVAEKYDIVILDAFNGDYIPFHLMTKEFLEQVKSVLAEDGVVVANVFRNNRLFDAELATFEAVFGRYQVFFGAYSLNAMITASGPKGQTLAIDEVVSRARMLQRKVGFAFDMLAVASQLQINVRPDPRMKVLVDDRAPVNRLREQRSKTGRAR